MVNQQYSSSDSCCCEPRPGTFDREVRGGGGGKSSQTIQPTEALDWEGVNCLTDEPLGSLLFSSLTSQPMGTSSLTFHPPPLLLALLLSGCYQDTRLLPKVSPPSVPFATPSPLLWATRLLLLAG